MKRFVGSSGLVTFSAVFGLFLAGCSDDGTSGDKTSASSGKKPSAGSGTGSAAKPAAESPKPEVKPTPKDSTAEIKPELKSEAKPEAKPAAAPPKPPEGSVRVKAEPDEPPATKPQSSLPIMPDDKPVAIHHSTSGPRSDASASSSAADDAAAPKFSAIASPEDLGNQLNLLIADLDKAVADEGEYKSQVDDRFVRDGNMITLVATALGLHDQDNAMKSHAAAIADADSKLADAKDFASTKKTVADVKAALEGSGGSELKWGKIATLNSLMKDEVPTVSEKLKDGLRHFEKKSAAASANAATLALIAENAKLYVGETTKPNESAKWTAFADQFRAAAGDVAAKVHAGDEAGANTAMDKVNQSCHDCHAVFNPEK